MATKKQPITNKYAHKPKLTKEEVITELSRMQSEGHSMKSTDFEPWFYRRIKEHFGGYAQAKKELGVSNVRKSGSGIVRRNIADVVAELKAIDMDGITLADFRDNHRHITEYSRNHLGEMYAIFEIAGVPLPKKKKRKNTPTRKYSEQDVREGMEEAYLKYGTTSSNVLKETEYKLVVNRVKTMYGTWNAGLVTLGYEVAGLTPKYERSKDDFKREALEAIASGVRPNKGSLDANVQGFNIATRKLFGGYAAFKEYAGYCELTERPKLANPPRKYRAMLSTEEGIQREILRMWYMGAPLNYNYIRKQRGWLLVAANELIGSWRQAVESIGINYDDITKASDTNILSECGTEFETLFAEILTELKYEYIREGEGLNDLLAEGFTLKPDFILPNWRWIDCKLSEWTDASEMLKRYQEMGPNGITIVYLRGRKHRKKRGRKWQYEHVSVYCFTEQLTQDRRKYYEDKLLQIERKADECAIAN